MLVFSLFIACTTEQPVVQPDITAPEEPKPTTNTVDVTSTEYVSPLAIEDSSVTLTLPTLSISDPKENYCYFQEMPEAEIGMTGLQFSTSDKVRFITLRGVNTDSIKVQPDEWMACSTLGDDIPTVPLYEVVGVDLTKNNGQLFNGFNWYNLPDNMAFAFPGSSMWMVKVEPESSAGSALSVSIKIPTQPADTITDWAGVFEMTMGPFSKPQHTSECELPTDVSLLSVFGFSAPATGTWTVKCGEETIASLEGQAFAGGPPPLKSLDPAQKIDATTCSLVCDWDGQEGTICKASMVVSPLKDYIQCIEKADKPENPNIQEPTE